MDGNFHDWLEERGPEGCLIDMVDDATNDAGMRSGEEETIWAAARALRAWIVITGCPRRCTRTGRMFISGNQRSGSGCEGRSR